MAGIDPLDVLISVGRALKDRERREDARQAAEAGERRKVAEAAAAARRRAERAAWTEIGGGWYGVPLVTATRYSRGRVTVVRRLAGDKGSVVEVYPWSSVAGRGELERAILALESSGRLESARWEIRS